MTDYSPPVLGVIEVRTVPDNSETSQDQTVLKPAPTYETWADVPVNTLVVTYPYDRPEMFIKTHESGTMMSNLGAGDLHRFHPDMSWTPNDNGTGFQEVRL